jgi:SAM-dependent methyltransferase
MGEVAIAADTVECVACGGEIDPVRDHTLRKDGFDLVRCRTCGMLMRASLPAEAELVDIYTPAYFAHPGDEPADGYANYVVDAEWHRRAARRRLRLLTRLGAPRGRLLDVGSAAGFFVHEAIAAGWRAEGIDIAESMVRWGRSHLQVPLRLGTLQAVDEPGAYSVVTMWDYLEHSVDPIGELRLCDRLLRSDGLLAVSTGDADSFAARVFGSRWHLLTPRHHNFFFSSTTLRRTLERCGFEVAWAQHPGARYSLSHLAYKFDRGIGLSPTEALARLLSTSRLGRIGVPVNLFDIVTVVARKRQDPGTRL